MLCVEHRKATKTTSQLRQNQTISPQQQPAHVPTQRSRDHHQKEAETSETLKPVKNQQLWYDLKCNESILVADNTSPLFDNIISIFLLAIHSWLVESSLCHHDQELVQHGIKSNSQDYTNELIVHQVLSSNQVYLLYFPDCVRNDDW